MWDALRWCMLMPPVSRYMTRSPYAVAPRDKLSAARELMRHYQIRHLPVIEDDELVGIVTDRDLLAINEPEDVVADAMCSQVPSFNEETPLDQVIAVMENRHLGSVAIVGRSGVAGIFTLTDAMRAFCDVLRRTEEGDR